MPAVKNVGEPCAREPHARFEVAAGGNQDQSGQHVPRGPGASRRPYSHGVSALVVLTSVFAMAGGGVPPLASSLILGGQIVSEATLVLARIL